MTVSGPSIRRRFLILLPVAATALVCIAINMWAIRTPIRFDLTSVGVYSIGPETKRAIELVDEPIAITFFYDLRNKMMVDAKALLDQYAASSSLISVRAIDPMLQPSQARRYRINFPGTAIFESGDRQVIVNGGSETDFTNGLIRIARRTGQRICFTDGHVESDPLSWRSHDHFEGAMAADHSHSSGGRPLRVHERHGMGKAGDALKILGYEVAKVLLLMDPAQSRDCAVVIVASPQKPFDPREARQLRDYLASGGAVVALLEPAVEHGLASILSDFGIAAGSRSVLDYESHYWTDPAAPAISAYPRHKITRDLALTFFPGALALEPVAAGVPRDVKIIPLAETSGRSELDGGAPGMAPRTLALLATRPSVSGEGNKKRPRLVVIGDGDFATNSYYHILGNGTLFLNVVNFLAEQDSLIDITPRGYEPPRLELTNAQMRFTFLFSTVLLPGLLLLAGAMQWWRNR